MTRGRPRSVLVAGAGVAGLGAAILLRRKGIACELHERAPRGGGLLEALEFHGVACDRGSHRVHADADAVLFELTRAVAWDERPRRGVMVLGGRHLPYPLHPLAFARGIGARSAAAMVVGWALRPRRYARFASWERDRGAPGHDEGFEDFVRARVGAEAYERFYRPYVEKVWGLDAGLLSRSIARQRLSTSSPWRSLVRYDRARGFLYPRDGMASVIDALSRECAALGVELRYNHAHDRASIVASRHDGVIYTGHLRELAPDDSLEHRGLYLVHLAFPRGTLDATDTWYLPEAHYWPGRVSQPARFSPSLSQPDAELLAVEIPEGRWGSARDFTRELPELVAQLGDARIIPHGARPLDARQTFVPDVYPIYLRGWITRWRSALDAVRALENVLPAGRQGLFLHCNIDHAMRTSADAVDHLARGEDAGAWIDRCERYLELRVRD